MPTSGQDSQIRPGASSNSRGKDESQSDYTKYPVPQDGSETGSGLERLSCRPGIPPLAVITRARVCGPAFPQGPSAGL